jgi:hypothetical protein
MVNRGRPASLRALCQAVFTLRMCVLGSCGLKKTYSETPLVTEPHSWSSDLTNDVIGKTRRPAAVLDWVTVIVDSSKSMSDHLSRRPSIPTRIPVSRSVITIVCSLASQHIRILCSSGKEIVRGGFLCLASLNSFTPSSGLWTSILRSTAKLKAARGNARSLFTPAGLTPSFILDSLKRSLFISARLCQSRSGISRHSSAGGRRLG